MSQPIVDKGGRKFGDDLGGIRTIEDLRLRCWINPDTECWEFRGGKAEPRVWLAALRITTTLPRAAFLLAGKEARAGKYVVWRAVGCSEDCANPDHMRAGSRVQRFGQLSRAGRFSNNPARPLINRANVIKSGRTKLNMELVQYIRSSPKTGRALSKELGVSESVISRARLGQTWKLSTPAASVFAWAADAANRNSVVDAA
jgi:hypothetical protein